jgi:hypothetical protein
MTTATFIGYLSLGAVALIILWKLLKRWRRHGAYQRAQSDPAILNAVLWWAKEFRSKTFPADPSVNPAPGAVRQSNTFRSALMRELANAYARDPDALDEDIGTGQGCSTLLSDAAAEAGFEAGRYFPRTLRMRIRDHYVSVTRSSGTFWEPVWRKGYGGDASEDQSRS